MTSIIVKLLGVVALLLLLFAGYQHIIQIGKDEQFAIDQIAADKLKLQAKDELLLETKRANDATKALQAMTDTLNQKDQEHENTVTDLYGKLSALGRLRDPNARRCGASGGSAKTGSSGVASPGPVDGAETSGVLSAELDGLLRRQAREADTINAAYSSCRSFAAEVKKACSQ